MTTAEVRIFRNRVAKAGRLIAAAHRLGASAVDVATSPQTRSWLAGEIGASTVSDETWRLVVLTMSRQTKEAA